MEATNLSNKLVRVEYPGIVKNVDNMIATLGGITAISEIDAPCTSWLLINENLGSSNVLSRILILIATFFVVLDNKLMPERYRMNIPRIFGLFIEYGLTYITMKITLFVWNQFLSLLCLFLKGLLKMEDDTKDMIYNQVGGDIYLGYFTTAISIIALWYSFKATGGRERFKNFFFSCCDTIVDFLLKICDCSDDENNVTNLVKHK